MTDPLLLTQIIGMLLYIPAALSSAYTTGRPRGLALAWVALLLAVGVTIVATIGEYWVAVACWLVTCALAIYRVVQEERRAVRS